MTEEKIRISYLEELNAVAPDIDMASVGDHDHLQDDLGLDSMDVLNFAIALHGRLGVDIPEADYPQIATLALAVPYLAAQLAANA